MAVWQIFKVSRKTFFNPSAWLNVDSIKENNRIIWDNIRGLFTADTPLHDESFEQAMRRLGLSETDIQQKEQIYYIYAWVFAALGGLVLIFSFYLLFYHFTFTGWLLAVAAAGLFFTQAFRFHFWYFQIKYRKLGVTFKEWRRGKPDEESTPP